MSHQPERQEKDCLNCGTRIYGRFCHQCGQENIVARQSFWSLATHFLYDIFHFDGKFFDTLRHLLFRPGRVPRGYVEGRRMKYLDPIRMYLFTSAVFFLIFFSTNQLGGQLLSGERFMSSHERLHEAARIWSRLRQGSGDTAAGRKMDLVLDTSRLLELVVPADSLMQGDMMVSLPNGRFMIVPQGRLDDSAFRLAENTWFGRKVKEKWEKEKEESGGDLNRLMADIYNAFLHQLPTLFFISLPLFALILQLCFGGRGNFYYYDHAVFTLYLYIFTFILSLLYLGISGLYTWSGWGLFEILVTALAFCWPVYLLLSLKRFYGQGWGRTLTKFLLVNALGCITLLLLFVIFALTSLVI